MTSVEVISGSVVITYGNAANTNIAGQRIVLLPGLTKSGAVIWACGYEILPDGVHPGAGPYGSDLAKKYLPASCREGGTDYTTLP